MTTNLPFDTPPHEIEVRITAGLRNPNVGRVVSATLKNGPKTFHFATLWEIINPTTKAHHHFCLRIDTYGRTKKDGWTERPEKSLVIDNDKCTELQDLVTLINSATAGHLAQDSGEYHVVDAADIQNIRQLLRIAKDVDSEQRMRVVQALLAQLDLEAIPASDWLNVFETGPAKVNEAIGIAARSAEYHRAHARLAELIDDDTSTESDFQSILSENPWMFGSEYSELLPRRTWTRDDRLDFMLRRTADGYLEIVEIKKPIREALLRYDQSHDSYSPSGPLALALGQVIRYIEEVERNRDHIIAQDQADSLKIRARVIIGRDGDGGQKAALRNLNGHLHRIEILTFDQLLRITKRVLAVFSEALGAEPEAIPPGEFPGEDFILNDDLP